MSGTAGSRPGDDALDDAVERLARSARQRNLGRADRVMELLGARGGASGATERAEAARLCHSIAGSAGTFGDDELADAARHVESLLQVGHPDQPALDRLRAAAEALRR